APGIDDHRADRVRAFMLKNRLPGCAVIVGAPNAAGGHADVVLALVVRVHGNRDHAAGDHRRPDGAKLQAAKGTAGHGIAGLGAFVFFLVVLLGFLVVLFGVLFVVLLVLGGVFVFGTLVGRGGFRLSGCRFVRRLGLAWR